MSWIYVLVRTFPFWAIPGAVTLIAIAVGKGKSGKERTLYFIVATILIAASVTFFALKGPSRAVPFVHDVLNGEEPR